MLAAWVAAASSAFGAEPDGAARYRDVVAPILDEFCTSCHSGGSAKGGVAFDADDPDAPAASPDLWAKSLRMVRAGLMPPKGKAAPAPGQVARLEAWIKTSALGIDPRNPDPGRPTLRRLNRVEYRNTVRDLLGVDFDTAVEFPADDTGHGFDTIGDVLSLSPLLLEKYLAAARAVVGQAVPTAPRVVAETRVPGWEFAGRGAGTGSLSYYAPAKVSHAFPAAHAGRYQPVADLTANESYVEGVFDYNRCRLVFKADGKVLHDAEYSRQGGRSTGTASTRSGRPGSTSCRSS